MRISTTVMDAVTLIQEHATELIKRGRQRKDRRSSGKGDRLLQIDV